MPTINAGKYGILGASSTNSFSQVRNATSANDFTSNQPTSSTAISVRMRYVSGGKGSEWVLNRAFFAFDVTSYQSGYNITNLRLRIDPSSFSSSNMPIAIIPSTAQGNANTNLSSSDFNNVDFSTLYAGSTSTYWPDTNSISDITLNSNAVSAFSTGYLKLAIVWWYDYFNQAPISPQTLNGYQNFTYVPRLEFTATATGYANNVIGVDGSDIDNIISVDSADIDNVAGI
tara:strand:- start:68 stop:757 length:690 start_codon:yes stop_codon:yes gene_type:complete